MFDYYQLQNLAGAELGPDEQLLWSGQPNPKRVMMQLDTFIPVAFSIPWTVASIFFICAATGFKIPDFTKAGVEFFLPLFGLPFVLIGLAMMSTPYWKYRKAQRTIYAVTNKRCLIIVKSTWSKKVKVFLFPQIGSFEIKERTDGTGDLLFAREKYTDAEGQPYTKRIGFLGIPEVRNVEQILEKTFNTQ